MQHTPSSHASLPPESKSQIGAPAHKYPPKIPRGQVRNSVTSPFSGGWAVAGGASPGVWKMGQSIAAVAAVGGDTTVFYGLSTRYLVLGYGVIGTILGSSSSTTVEQEIG